MRRIGIAVIGLTVCVCGSMAWAQMPMGAAPAAAAKPKAPLSTSLSMTVTGKTMTFTVAQLETMPQKTITVDNEHTKNKESYTGVPLETLLAQCGATYTPATQKMFLHSTVRAIGTDQYFVIYSASEVESGLHAGDVIVATKMNGGSLGDDGRIKLISTEDKKPARWVRNLVSITVTEQQ